MDFIVLPFSVLHHNIQISENWHAQSFFGKEEPLHPLSIIIWEVVEKTAAFLHFALLIIIWYNVPIIDPFIFFMNEEGCLRLLNLLDQPKELLEWVPPAELTKGELAAIETQVEELERLNQEEQTKAEALAKAQTEEAIRLRNRQEAIDKMNPWDRAVAQRRDAIEHNKKVALERGRRWAAIAMEQRAKSKAIYDAACAFIDDYYFRQEVRALQMAPTTPEEVQAILKKTSDAVNADGPRLHF